MFGKYIYNYIMLTNIPSPPKNKIFMEVIFYLSVLPNSRFILQVLKKTGFIRVKCNLKSCYCNHLVSSLCNCTCNCKYIYKLMFVLEKKSVHIKNTRGTKLYISYNMWLVNRVVFHPKARQLLALEQVSPS